MKVRLKEICEGSCKRVIILDNPSSPVLEGTSLEIVKTMMRDVGRKGHISGYLSPLVRDMVNLGLKVSFSGKSETEMAESFLNSCREAHLLTVVD